MFRHLILFIFILMSTGCMTPEPTGYPTMPPEPREEQPADSGNVFMPSEPIYPTMPPEPPGEQPADSGDVFMPPEPIAPPMPAEPPAGP